MRDRLRHALDSPFIKIPRAVIRLAQIRSISAMYRAIYVFQERRHPRLPSEILYEARKGTRIVPRISARGSNTVGWGRHATLNAQFAKILKGCTRTLVSKEHTRRTWYAQGDGALEVIAI